MSRIPVSRKDRVRSEAKKRRVADSNIQTNALSDTDVNALIAQYLIDNPVGGSVGKIVAFTSGQIASGASGDILTATAPVGQYLEVSHLMTATSTGQVGLTLTVDGVNIFTSEELADTTPPANANTAIFGVARGYGSTSVAPSARILKSIRCNSFTLTRVAATTTQDIDYAYETLEAL